MATRIPQRELRNNNAGVLNRAAAGESFVVTRNGVPVADVVPHVEPNGPPRFPYTSDLMATQWAAPDRGVDREAWVRDIRAADEIIGDDPLDSRA